jgi:hypothetical protein
MAEAKRGRGRPATLTEEGRQSQLREAQAAHRARASKSGKVRLDASVNAETKAKVEAYRSKHALPSIGAALDAILANLK